MPIHARYVTREDKSLADDLINTGTKTAMNRNRKSKNEIDTDKTRKWIYAVLKKNSSIMQLEKIHAVDKGKGYLLIKNLWCTDSTQFFHTYFDTLLMWHLDECGDGMHPIRRPRLATTALEDNEASCCRRGAIVFSIISEFGASFSSWDSRQTIKENTCAPIGRNQSATIGLIAPHMSDCCTSIDPTDCRCVLKTFHSRLFKRLTEHRYVRGPDPGDRGTILTFYDDPHGPFLNGEPSNGHSSFRYKNILTGIVNQCRNLNSSQSSCSMSQSR
ncbi:unnamed protein product [Nesidiocoris tenuis]|uniref:Uncharacterized protein n=1 Tax=Nesidiocoris tenuis TaxID=355587 RepID=A0A6H5HYS8_9HEMI|nr:unnamed protein product [Nesidiocoris tenuis]